MSYWDFYHSAVKRNGTRTCTYDYHDGRNRSFGEVKSDGRVHINDEGWCVNESRRWAEHYVRKLRNNKPFDSREEAYQSVRLFFFFLQYGGYGES